MRLREVFVGDVQVGYCDRNALDSTTRFVERCKRAVARRATFQRERVVLGLASIACCKMACNVSPRSDKVVATNKRGASRSH